MSQQLLSVIAPFMHELGSKAAQSLNAVSHKPSLACREWQTLVRDYCTLLASNVQPSCLRLGMRFASAVA